MIQLVLASVSYCCIYNFVESVDTDGVSLLGMSVSIRCDVYWAPVLCLQLYRAHEDDGPMVCLRGAGQI